MELTESPIEDVEVEEPLSDVLNHSDRCDQCGAQAFVWVAMPKAESGLLFCSHHFNRNEEILKKVWVGYIDERYKINLKASASSPD